MPKASAGSPARMHRPLLLGSIYVLRGFTFPILPPISGLGSGRSPSRCWPVCFATSLPKTGHTAVPCWCALRFGSRDLERWPPVVPRLCLLELGGEAQEHRLIAEIGPEVNADRKAGAAPVERQ